MEEIWKPVSGFDGYYEVSNLGNVKSIDRYIIDSRGRRRFFKGQVLKTRHSHNGYVLCNLKKDGNNYNVRVNRLVAKAFVENPENYDEVNHIDFNKDNNKATNLEWCSNKYNINYTYKNDKSKSQKHVQKIDPITMEVLDEYISLAEAARINKGRYQNISRCCKHDGYTHLGYMWRFVSD